MNSTATTAVKQYFRESYSLRNAALLAKYSRINRVACGVDTTRVVVNRK